MYASPPALPIQQPHHYGASGRPPHAPEYASPVQPTQGYQQHHRSPAPMSVTRAAPSPFPSNHDPPPFHQPPTDLTSTSAAPVPAAAAPARPGFASPPAENPHGYYDPRHNANHPYFERVYDNVPNDVFVGEDRSRSRSRTGSSHSVIDEIAIGVSQMGMLGGMGSPAPANAGVNTSAETFETAQGQFEVISNDSGNVQNA